MMMFLQIQKEHASQWWVKYFVEKKGRYALSDVPYIINENDIIDNVQPPSIVQCGQRFYYRFVLVHIIMNFNNVNERNMTFVSSIWYNYNLRT